MTLAVTSIWIELFRRGRFKAELEWLVANNQLCTHPFVIAELACGSIPDRKRTLHDLDALFRIAYHSRHTLYDRDPRSLLARNWLYRRTANRFLPCYAWYANLDRTRVSADDRALHRVQAEADARREGSLATLAHSCLNNREPGSIISRNRVFSPGREHTLGRATARNAG
jgi:predicted nucleic acid-binding protein